MESKREKNRFSIIARIKSTNHALRGLRILIETGHNFWVHIFFGVLAIYLGNILQISNTEWILLVLAIGLVFIAEVFNTAIEIDIDLTSPEYHPFAKDTKDVSAAAVSIAIIIAGIVGIMIFLPKLILLIK